MLRVKFLKTWKLSSFTGLCALASVTHCPLPFWPEDPILPNPNKVLKGDEEASISRLAQGLFSSLVQRAGILLHGAGPFCILVPVRTPVTAVLLFPVTCTPSSLTAPSKGQAATRQWYLSFVPWMLSLGCREGLNQLLVPFQPYGKPEAPADSEGFAETSRMGSCLLASLGTAPSLCAWGSEGQLLAARVCALGLAAGRR